MCRPALPAAIPATIGRLSAVNRGHRARAVECFRGRPRSARPAIALQVSAVPRSAPLRGTLQGRCAAALISRATDSPSTISTKIWNRSARCEAAGRIELSADHASVGAAAGRTASSRPRL